MDLYGKAEEALEWAVLHLELLAEEVRSEILQPFCRAWSHGIYDKDGTLQKASQSSNADIRASAKALLDVLSMRECIDGSAVARLMAVLKIGLGAKEPDEAWLNELSRPPGPPIGPVAQWW